MFYLFQILKNNKKSKIYFTILLILVFLLALSYGFIFIKNYLELKDLHQYPVSYFLSDELYGGEVFVTYDNGKRSATELLTNDGKPKTHLEMSPNGQKLGYFLELNSFIDKEKNKKIDSIDYDNYTALIIMNTDASEKKEIYKGDYHTSYWEWLDNNEVAVYYNCGSECMIGFVIDVDTGTEEAKLLYGVGHEWSPNKELVVAYHYSGGYGITVGDKYGNVLFEFRRPLPSVYSKLAANETKATWSEDGKTLSLVIKKENEEKLEIIKFDVDNDFKIISQH